MSNVIQLSKHRKPAPHVNMVALPLSFVLAYLAIAAALIEMTQEALRER